MSCLDMERLSMHLDRELDLQTEREVVAHLDACKRCAAKLRALQESEAYRTNVMAQAGAVPAADPTCYGAGELSAYASGQLTPLEAQSLEQHLFACDVCLREVMGLCRTQTQLRHDGLIAPPPRLVAAAQRASDSARPRPAVERLSTIIIRLVRGGLEFVEAALLPEHVRLTVGEQLIPAGAFRSPQGDAAAAGLLDFQQTVGDLTLRMQMLHENQQSVLLRLQVHKQGSPWRRQRVSLLSGGRTLGARQTSDRGEVEFSRLPPGDYVVRLPRENVETELILRA